MTQPESKKSRRKPRHMPPGCPIGENSLKVAELSHDLVRALRRLRHDLQHCQVCSRQETGCPLRQEYNTLVSQTVEEVWEEWGSPASLTPIVTSDP